jgi:hypothetical protein
MAGRSMSVHPMARWIGALLAAVALSPVAAHAQNKPATATQVFAVMSLVGDKIDVIVTRAQGGAPQAAQRGAIPINGPAFDTAAVEAASKAIWRVSAKAEIATLAVRGKAIYEKQTEWFAESGGTIRIPEEVVKGAREQGATHLVLIGKQRTLADVKPKPGNTWAGFRGELEGLGFVVDQPAGKTGALVPFAFLKVLVIELSTRAVIGRNTIAAASPIPAEARSADEAWIALAPAQKLRAIEFMLRDEVGNAVQSMFELLLPN